jgi:hypothetical protein
MMGVRYTICSYYPDLTRPNSAYDFAVLAASSRGIALVGVNVASAHGLQGLHPLAKAVADQSFQIVERRIREALKSADFQSPFDLLDRVVENNLSNIQYRPFVDVEGDDAEAAARGVFREIQQRSGALSRGDARQDVLCFRLLLLRLDEQDRNAVLGGMPSYSVYGLRYSAVKLVQSATVLYRHLRREGRLQNGFAFCGRLRQAFDNAGNAISPPPGMAYIVYADPDGYVFDWDWVEEDPDHPGYPVDADRRFTGNPETKVPEAVLVGVDNLAPAPFDSQKAWPSPLGDCIFCYFSDEFAYADRINDDLTVFRSVATKEPTGFKIKNVQRILDDGYLRVAAPDLEVKVQVVLFAAFQRNPDMEYFPKYSKLMDTWKQRSAGAEPDKVVLPRPREVCHAGA